MFISEALTDFLEHLEVESGRSQKTIINYQLYLERFIDFAGDISVDKITSELIRQYRLWLNRYKNNNTAKLPPYSATRATHISFSSRYKESGCRQNHPTKDRPKTSNFFTIR